jgi:hypothetical protein
MCVGKWFLHAHVLLSIDLRWGGFRKPHPRADLRTEFGIEIDPLIGFGRAFLGVDME